MNSALKPSLSVAIIAVTGALLFGSAARAQAPDPADIAAGARLFRQKGNCQACHGWAGDGRKIDNQMPDGANLRESVLDRETLILLDQVRATRQRDAGVRQVRLQRRPLLRPEAGRPQITQAADARSAGDTAAARDRAIADFLFAKVIGQGPMDRAKCIEYWGSDVEACSEFAK